MLAGELCTRQVYLARPEDPLSQAAHEMRKRHVGALVVAAQDGNRTRPIGILTDRDILRGQLARSADLFCLTVADVMTREPLTLCESEDVAVAINRLAAARVRRTPVVNAQGDLVGILTLDDLLPVIAGRFTILARLFATQSRVEKSSAPNSDDPRD